MLLLLSPLAISAVLIAVSYLIWFAVLGPMRARLGHKPLTGAYLLFVPGWFFSAITGLLQNSGPIYGNPLLVFFFGMPIALLLIGAIGIPVAAYLVRTHRAGYQIAIALLVLFLVGFAFVTWLWTGGSWLPLGQPDGFLRALGLVFAYGLPAGSAFCVGLVYSLREQLERTSPIGAPPGDRGLSQLPGQMR